MPFKFLLARYLLFFCYRLLTSYSTLKRGSYMSAHVSLNLLNELGKRDKMRGLPSIYLFFATSLINSIIQEHEC